MLRRSNCLFATATHQQQQQQRAAATIKHQVAIVGSGPSGCYVAQQLSKLMSNDLHVDIYEKLPVPFGLSRYGVAPDHPEVKNVEKTFNTQLFEVPEKFTLLCNVAIGTDITLNQLRQSYSAVVLATGCSGERHLEIPGEGMLGNVISSKRFVEWYNTVPFPQSSPLTCPLTSFLKIDEQESNIQKGKFILKGTEKSTTGPMEQVVLIGNGNVALDIARVLSASYKHWCSTDMNCFAVRDLMSIADRNIKKVTIVARRGVEHSAFTTKEFRELTKLDENGIKVVVEPFDLEAALERSVKDNGGQQPVQGLKRKLELMKKFEYTGDFDEVSREFKGRCLVVFRFGYTPKKMIPKSPSHHQVGAVLFETKNNSDDDEKTAGVAIPADAVITCVGYAGERIRTFPFDEKRKVIPTDQQGRVTGQNFLYSVGWARNGPKGVILASLTDAKLVAKTIADDLTKWNEEYEKVIVNFSENDDKNEEEEIMKVEEIIEEEEVSSSSSKEHQQQQQQEKEVSSQTAALDKLLLLTKHKNNNKNNNNMTISPPGGKYDLVDHFIARKVFPLGISTVRKIWKVEIEKGVDLGKRMEKIPAVSDMLNLASGGKLARKTEDRLRGRPILGRMRGLELMEDYLDPKSLLADMSEEWMRSSNEALLNEQQKMMMEGNNNNNKDNNSIRQEQLPSRHEKEKFLSSAPTSSLIDKMEPNLQTRKK